MKEIVVVSGKGGTGKTSLLASFAALAERTVLADCDVDAADLYLLLAPTVRRRERFVGGNAAFIRLDLCVGCGLCLARCRYGAVVQEDGAFRVDPLSCEGCGVCVWSCPAKAIGFPPRESGEWFVSDTRHGPLVHARLGIAESNSGKLVARVRDEARRLAEERGLDLILTDGPPGVGCPVIASIAGASLVLIVAEPTPSGLHDFERAADLAAHFGAPALACVNRADINPDAAARIRERCGRRGVPFLGEVPYDGAVTRAQLRGRSVVEEGDGPAARAIRTLWQAVRRALDALGSSRTGAAAVRPAGASDSPE